MDCENIKNRLIMLALKTEEVPENGDEKAVGLCYAEQEQIRQELMNDPHAYHMIFHELLYNNNAQVRLFAAYAMLPMDRDGRALNVLRGISGREGPFGLPSEMMACEWVSGRLTVKFGPFECSSKGAATDDGTEKFDYSVFPYPVSSVFPMDDKLIVILDVPMGDAHSTFRRNVYAVAGGKDSLADTGCERSI